MPTLLLIGHGHLGCIVRPTNQVALTIFDVLPIAFFDSTWQPGMPPPDPRFHALKRRHPSPPPRTRPRPPQTRPPPATRPRIPRRVWRLTGCVCASGSRDAGPGDPKEQSRPTEEISMAFSSFLRCRGCAWSKLMWEIACVIACAASDKKRASNVLCVDRGTRMFGRMLHHVLRFDDTSRNSIYHG